MKTSCVVKSLLSDIVIIAVGCFLFSAASCTVAKHPTAGLYASLGGDTNKFKADASGFSFDRNENSVAFKEAAQQLKKAFADYLLYKGLVFLGGEYFTHENTKVSSAEKLRLDELRSAESIEEMRQKTRQLEILTEQPLT